MIFRPATMAADPERHRDQNYHPGTTSAQDALRYDGRGKWTGYTSEWRSRPQILRDAGIAPER